MKYTFKPSGVCSDRITVDIEGDMLRSVEFYGGCNGNSKGIGRLCENMKVKDVAKKLEGITCGFKKTSCPDQLSKALKAYMEQNGIESD